MSYRNDEEIGSAIQKLLSKRSAMETREGCPDEESLATYLTGSISDQQKEKLEKHLAECHFCLSEITAASESGAMAHAPQGLVERAMALVAASKQDGVLDLVVRFVKDSLELVRQSGDWIVPMAPQPVAVRGAQSPFASGLVHVEKEFGELKVAIEMERGESDLCQLSVTLFAADGKPAEGMRVSLIAGEREQASYLARQGRAVFDSITNGNYKLIISRGGASLGMITLSVEAEP